MKTNVLALEQKKITALTVLMLPVLISYPMVGYGLSSQAEASFSASPLSSVVPNVTSNESLGARITERLTSQVGVEEIRCVEENSEEDGNVVDNLGSKIGYQDCIEKESDDYGVAYPQLKNPGLSGYIGFGYEHVVNAARVSGEDGQDEGGNSNSFNTGAGIGYQNRAGNLSYRIGGTLSRKNLDEGDTFDSNQYGLSAGALYTVNKRLSLGLNWAHNEGRLPRNSRGTRDLGDPNERNDSNEFDIIGGQINIGSSQDRFQLSLAASYSENDYSLAAGNTDSGFSDIRDTDVENYSASLIYNYSPRTRFFIDSNYANYSYAGETSESDPSRDSNQYGTNIGIISDINEKLTFKGKVGYKEKDYDNDLRSDQTIADYDAALNYQLSPKASVSFYVASTFEESAFIDASGIESELVGVSLNYQLIPNKMFITAYYNNVDDEFIDSVRDDSTEDYGLAVVYKLTQDLSLNLEAGRNSRDSNLDEFDYSSESYGLSINYAFGN